MVALNSAASADVKITRKAILLREGF